jgi:integrase/recombinase XerD
MARKGYQKTRKPAGDPNDPQGMAVLLGHHLEWLRVHNYSELTVLARLNYLNRFILWATERGVVRPSEVTKPILERYQRWLFHYRKKGGDPLSFASQHSHLVPIRGWFKWLTKHNYLLYNPASELELPKVGRSIPKNVLTDSEAESVINQTNVNEAMGIRDRAMLETFYSTGIRRMELINLCIYDIDRIRGTVLIRQGKGKKDRTVPIGERALSWIDRYEQEVRPKMLIGDRGGDVLFLTHFGEAFTPARLTQMVMNYVEAADLGKSGSCHLFRHTMATVLLENGVDIRYIQLMLGHASLSTTELYTQVSIRKLKDIHTAAHPAKMHREEKNGQEARQEAEDGVE